MVHLRFVWLELSKDPHDLQAILTETQTLRSSNLSTALLTIFLDSAKNLPQARMSTKPDPYAVIKVGNKTQQTNVLMRTIHPVWEQGFTFPVVSPDNDSVFVTIMDHKTGNEIGQLIYKIKNILTNKDMEISKEPFALLKSGPESKLIWSIHLRILKRKNEAMLADEADDSSMDSFEPIPASEGATSVSRTNSVEQSKGVDEKMQEDRETVVMSETASVTESSPQLLHRTQSVTSSAGEAGLGRILMSLKYSVERQRLIVEVKKVMNLPHKDPSSIPDPYVKLYLLPERSKDSKRKTQVVKDNCNPAFEEAFEYVINQRDLGGKKLEVTVCTQKQVFYSSGNVLGQVIIDLGKVDLAQPYSSWFDLQREANSNA
ncbi:unnamed protein product [Acanthoscelides obtectus]|nr:unnamed protein product [Acanthoscelides obtectus]CAK1670633.1 Extended synaptotagmin-2 [Acanthoscelides obtectus]